MDEFSYLSVLLSIIIGLAMTEILQGTRGRMLSHKRVQPFWPSHVWATTLLLICKQTWWAMFGLRDRHDWKFGQVLVLLALTVLLYLIADLIYPDFGEEKAVDPPRALPPAAKAVLRTFCSGRVHQYLP